MSKSEHLVVKIGSPNLYYNERLNKWGFFENASMYATEEEAIDIKTEAEEMMPDAKFKIVKM